MYIYIYMVVGQNSFILERPFFANKKLLSRSPCLSFAGPILGNSSFYEDSLITCPITPNHHRSPNDTLANMQLASPSPFSGQMVADCAFSCAKLTSQPPSKCTWTFARSFAELSQNFRRTFAKTSLSADPSHQQKAHQRKTNTRGLGAWLSQSLLFGSLAAAFGACFLRLQKATLGSTSGRSKDSLHDHGVWLWRSLTFGSYEGKVNVRSTSPHSELNQNQADYPSPAGSPGGRGW